MGWDSNTVKSRHKLARVIDEGYEHERADCTVRTIQNLTGVPYRDAHGWCLKHGRKARQGFNFTARMAGAQATKEIVFGWRVRQVQLPFSVRKPTLTRVMPMLRQGRYAVLIAQHVFAVVDGMILDSGYNGARCRVRSVWQFEASSEVERREAAAAAATSESGA